MSVNLDTVKRGTNVLLLLTGGHELRGKVVVVTASSVQLEAAGSENRFYIDRAAVLAVGTMDPTPSKDWV